MADTFPGPPVMEADAFERLLISRAYKFAGITSSFTDDGGRIFDREIPQGEVRVVIYPDDGPRATIHFFARTRARTTTFLDHRYKVECSPGTPEAVILAALEAAEVAR